MLTALQLCGAFLLCVALTKRTVPGETSRLKYLTDQLQQNAIDKSWAARHDGELTFASFSDESGPWIMRRQWR